MNGDRCKLDSPIWTEGLLSLAPAFFNSKIDIIDFKAEGGFFEHFNLINLGVSLCPRNDQTNALK